MRDKIKEYKVYWGDIHRSSTASGGKTSMEEHFKVAREDLNLDFFALADNAYLTENPMKYRFYMEKLKGPKSTTDGRTPEYLDPESIMKLHQISETNWKKLQKLVRNYHQPNKFVTFLAYEWCSAKYGDRNIYYFNDDEPLRLARNLSQLYQQLSKVKCMIIPHHPGYAVGRRGVDWNYHDRRLERLVEIFSLHGSSEKPVDNEIPLRNIGMGSNVPGSSVQEALNRGYKLGIIASSDCHEDPRQVVLAGVYSQELTREGIWEALWNRHCFGTTGEKIKIEFFMDNYPMGSIYATDSFPNIKVSVKGTARIKRVELVKNGSVVYNQEGDENYIEFELTDTEIPFKPDNYYYVRVLQEDANMGWSSPIWVSYLPELEPVRGYLYWQTEFEIHFKVEKRGSKIILSCENNSLENLPVYNILFRVYKGDKLLKPVSENIFDKLNAGSSVSTEFLVENNGKGLSSETIYEVSYLDCYQNLRYIRRKLPTIED